MWDFISKYFDKLVMFFLILMFTGLTVHLVHVQGVETALINWSCGLVGGAVGSLTTLIVGKHE